MRNIFRLLMYEQKLKITKKKEKQNNLQMMNAIIFKEHTYKI